ncbi:DNA-processing protein DprA [Variovorax paradoxus]|uniref:DNA-processing protein DprA n=1 Tax=Variovorax paradoxus TaxID=34073 RepID=UPI003ED06A72
MHATLEARPPRPLGAISPLEELGAYEWLWKQDSEPLKASFKNISAFFAQHPKALPSDLAPLAEALRCGQEVLRKFKTSGVRHFGIRLHRAGDYPDVLADAEHPLEMLYYQGDWDLAYSPKRIAIVGTRRPSSEAIRTTRGLVKDLVADGFVIVSGLAAGIDTAAHEAAIEFGGRTIAVIGTPLSKTYPPENAHLQRKIATEHLLISQIPVLRYEAQDYRLNRFFFPERNITMSALTQGTLIVEAGETSGTLIQARAAFAQGRKLLILDKNFHSGLTWPHRFETMGATRVRHYGDIVEHFALGSSPR